ncbi:23186_t:CDS:2, partial [Gigaspora margarita]
TFEIKKEIDQSKTIFPLLLQPLARLYLKSYTTWLYVKSQTLTDIRQVVLTFTNDTIWLANGQKQLEEIINIANTFYKINNIQVNSKKFKLLVFNKPTKLKSRQIEVCGSMVQEKKPLAITCFLEV